MSEHMHDCDNLLKTLADVPPEEELYDLADFFKVFADCTRIRILCTLLCGEMCVSDIGQALQMTQSAISHQLRVLKQAKLVKNRREGKTIYYSLSDGHIISILSQGLEHIEE
ncbi:MAG: helix-turn-helix transcriptional regulator [Lachnospiraceae bacterium]|nr:helix-turn-helix transcriptional regulator [Lachnospiraceae bacterium]MBR5765143.1 helix-turn-helix transcriptional regulator [Lachnospiraceae bacterium]MBR6468954.1 helix-turn-helix transcriptional regulator [Lachnospiraceae bacterium]MBR6487081.1 helix-turn-helix transcriptional regulator [Lachnospiraceae bacterium]